MDSCTGPNETQEEAPGVTSGTRGVNGASFAWEGSEWAWGTVAAEMSEQDRRRCGWGRTEARCGVPSQGDFEQRHYLS